MQITKPIKSLLKQLEYAINGLSETQYATAIPVLSGASVGKHLRHVIEFFDELLKGYQTGTVNYDRRQRNPAIETSREMAVQKLADIAIMIDQRDKPLLITASFPVNGIESIELSSNYQRELLYNLEHMVHHMAVIRIGIEAVSGITLSATFGVAESTLQFRNACAQ